jgi:hypothetical protein
MTRQMATRATAALVAAMAVGSPAFAQAQTLSARDMARADALFTAAKRLRDAGLYADACPVFADVERLAPGVGVMLHLADCYEHLGRAASATAEFRKAEKLAAERNDKRVSIAQARADALESKVKRAPIASAKPTAIDATVADRPTTPAPEHVTFVAAEAARVAAAPASVQAADTASTMPPAFSSATPEAGAPRMSHATRSWMELGLLGAGVLGLGAGAALLAVKDDAIARGNDASGAGTASAFAFAAGGAAFASSLLLYLTAPSDGGTALRLSPMPVVAGAGAAIRGSF